MLNKSNLELKKGNFTQVPNELLEFLMQHEDLNGTELKVCIFLIRQLTGWDYEFKPIEIETFLREIRGSNERSIKEALKTLIAKKVILKVKVPGYRHNCFAFNKDLIGRVLVGDAKQLYRDENTVVNLQTFKSMKVRKIAPSRKKPLYPEPEVQKTATSECSSPHLESAENCTLKTQETATRAAEQAPKYSEIHINTVLRSKNLDKLTQTLEHLNEISRNKTSLTIEETRQRIQLREEIKRLENINDRGYA